MGNIVEGEIAGVLGRRVSESDSHTRAGFEAFLKSYGVSS